MSHSTGSVTGDGNDVGGLVGVGYNYGDMIACFWDTETSGQAASAGGTGRTTAEMQTASTFLDAGWDFVGETANGTCDYWRMPPSGYPLLHYPDANRLLMPEGLGTAEQPYLVRDARDLGTVWFKPLAHYRLAESVDLAGITWSMAVIPWFGGSFDGNSYVISNLHIQGSDYLGLFGRLGFMASVSNLGLEAVEVSGTGLHVGGLVGYNDGGTISTSYSAGSVTGDYVGGLVGSNYGSITNSYSTGAVSGEKMVVGGLVGNNHGSVAQCYSTGAVSGTGGRVGGLVGLGSYSSNSPTVTGSFWDTQTSGQATSSGGGTGKTTAEMQTAKTFLDAGWDFVGETKNGTEDIWWLLEGKDYPRLWWEAAKK